MKLFLSPQHFSRRVYGVMILWRQTDSQQRQLSQVWIKTLGKIAQHEAVCGNENQLCCDLLKKPRVKCKKRLRWIVNPRFPAR